MRGTGKKARHQESRKSSLSNGDKDSGSVLIASLKRKKGSKISLRNQHKPDSKSHYKLSEKLAADSSSKGIGNESSGKLVSRNVLHKAVDKNSSGKVDSVEAHGKNSLVIGAGGNGKNADEDGLIRKNKKRKNRRRKKNKPELDEPSRLKRRTRYLLIRIKLEQNLIDAYSGEGWKGQSREKIKPEKELIRANKQILKCKLGLRDAIHQLDNLSRVGCIEDSVIAPDGSVSHEHIFCAKCKSNEVFPDNDIILCDGTCNCAFHQKCLDPPLDTENIPPGDQGWFCTFCECRMEIIESINAHLGTDFSVDSNWQDIFQEEAAFSDGGSMLLNPEEEWPSDDSEDDDYVPERRENNISSAGTDDDTSDGTSSSTSSSWSSNDEVSSGARRWHMEGMDFRNPLMYSSLDSDETSDGEIMYGHRRRRAVDYKKLYDEMFGKDAPADEQVSQDEDWGPGKRRRREKESDAASTLMTLYETCKEADTMGVEMKLPQDLQSRRQYFRISPDAVEKLRQVFAENELPPRSVKESLSKELGLEPGKVSKWFKNARYLALKSRKAGKTKHHLSRAKTSGESRLDSMKNETTLKDSSSEAWLHRPNNVKRFIQRKKPKSISSSAKTNELKRGSLGSPAKSNEVNGEYSDDVSLKKLLKAKAKRGRNRADTNSTWETQAAEAELKRLCVAKIRLENMKVTLMKLQSGKARKPSRTHHLFEESVIYVPIAELREKV
uniref:Uncharacterized protein MANES_14G158300 n=3 Tax=Rhizophora mucronata TaxID=61149 RepID=A0A2P2JCF9_RHIMU